MSKPSNMQLILECFRFMLWEMDIKYLTEGEYEKRMDLLSQLQTAIEEEKQKQ